MNKNKKNILDVLTDIQKQQIIPASLKRQLEIKKICQPTIKVLAK